MRAILTFHAVEARKSVLSISGEALHSLLVAIIRSGHEIIPLRKLLSGDSGSNAIALSFDDGSQSVIEKAEPILRAFEAPATLFLTTGFAGGCNAWPSQPATAPVFAMLNWDAIGSLSDSGWAIEAHTINHPDLCSLDDEALEEELAGPADVIERRTGSRPRILAYPYGNFNARVIKAVQAHYDYAVTTQFRRLRKEENPYLVPRLDSYYLRPCGIHRHFGNSSGFATYLSAISLLRRLRGHLCK